MARYLTTATLVALAMFSSPASMVDAASTGTLGYCSLAPTYKYGKGSTVMNWVNPPVFTDFYTVRSADTIQPITAIPASDPTSYIPGQWTPIHLRVHDLNRKYIGLVMYATNGPINATTGLTSRAGTQVGEWQVTSNMAFQSPATCGGTALTHSDADLKPIHSVFYFRAPAGTGTVSFHVMIKQGEQNQGSFFYPQFTLTLTEAAVPALPTTLMIESDPKQSCTAACAATAAYKNCDETATAGLSSAAALSTALTGAGQRQLICRPQIVSGCVAVAPGRQPDDICAFKSTTCVADGRATGATTCAATSARTDLTRFCMCTKTAVTTTAPTTAATTAPTTAATTAPTTKAPATTAPTSAATTAPTSKATAAPTSATTTAPTSTATSGPTYSATTATPTSKATAGPTSTTTAPTTKATTAPTSAATTVPTSKATVGPTSSTTTTGPTSKATAGPTSKPTSAPSGAGAATSAPTRTGTAEATAAPTNSATEAPTDGPTNGPADSSSNGDMSSTGLTGINAASSRTVQSLFSTLFTMFVAVLLSGSRRASLLLSVIVSAYLVLSVPAVTAHNWVMSPSRADLASVLKPCQARISPFPHIQVVPGQVFPQEWSVGHGNSRFKSYYWVLIKATDFEKLNMVNDAVIEEYFRSAPFNALWYNTTSTLGSKWTKRHMGQNKNEAANSGTYFAKKASPTDTDYIVRDATYREKSIFSNRNINQITQFIFHANETTKDIRVSYKNTKYPYIIAAHKFINVFDEHTPYSREANIANFEIPTGSTPGDYIYHFIWGGYRDCVDVNVLEATTAQPLVERPFGKTRAEMAKITSPFVKLDHCEFIYAHNPVTECRIAPRTTTPSVNVSQCIADCGATSGCTAVQVVRAANPVHVRIPFPVAIPYHRWNITEATPDGPFPLADPSEPCQYHAINERESMGCKDAHPPTINGKSNPAATCNPDVLEPLPDDYVCYGLIPYRVPGQEAVESYQTVEDPQDPKFYSTCFLRVESGGFLSENEDSMMNVPMWSVGDQCLSCSFRDAVTKLDLKSSPKWELSITDQCRNCDEPSL